jgi:hypothetical protein
MGRKALEGGAEALVEQRPAPLAREVGDGLRSGEREGADITMGAARDDDVGPTAEVPADPVSERGVAGDVDDGGRARRERLGLVVRQNLVVQGQAAGEGQTGR